MLKDWLESHPLAEGFSFVDFFGVSEPAVKPSPNKKYYIEGYAAKLIRATLSNSGYSETKKLSESNLIVGSSIPTSDYGKVKPHQRMNHFVYTFSLGSKDGYHDVITALAKRVGHPFSFYPETYHLPKDRSALSKSFANHKLWIEKPAGGSRGNGIHVVDSIKSLPSGDIVVQQYVDNPMLINGLKFDLRFYVGVISLDPLTVFLFDNGLVRLATSKYEENFDDLSNLGAHLTNFSINKNYDGYVMTNDVSKDGTGNKWSHRPFWPWLTKNGYDADKIHTKIEDAITTVVISATRSLRKQRNHFTSFEIFGFDVMLDTDQNVYILEVNVSPAMGTSSELDKVIKEPVVKDSFNMALIPSDPDVASKLAQAPPNTPASDYIALYNYESSISRCGAFKPIFPVPERVSFEKMLDPPTRKDQLLAEYVALAPDDRKKMLESMKVEFDKWYQNLK